MYYFKYFIALSHWTPEHGWFVLFSFVLCAFLVVDCMRYFFFLLQSSNIFSQTSYVWLNFFCFSTFHREWICRKSTFGSLCQTSDWISSRATWKREEGKGAEIDRRSGGDEGQARGGGSREEEGCHSNTRRGQASRVQEAVMANKSLD